MITWILLVIALGASQILFLTGQISSTYAYVLSILVLMASLGMLYRVYTKQAVGEKEKLIREIEELKEAINNATVIVENREDIEQEENSKGK